MLNIYDEDNIDLEEQLYLKELQEEMENEEDIEIEDLENIIEDDFSKQYLMSQCRINESKRDILTIQHMKSNKIFEGIVIGQSTTDDNKFVFSVYEIVNNIKSEKKTKIFNINDLIRV